MTKVNTAKELHDILNKTLPYIKVENPTPYIKVGDLAIGQHILAFGFTSKEDLELVKDKFIKFMHDTI
jgi:hypothetical protein